MQALLLIKRGVEKGLAEIDSIEYSFKKGADELSAEDFSARQDKTLADLESLASKSGIVGVRANMLKAEILLKE